MNYNFTCFDFRKSRAAIRRIMVFAQFGFVVMLGAQATYPVTYFLPLPEGELRTSLRTLAPSITNFTQMTSVVSLVTLEAGTIIVYDHWEDGYEADINNPVQPTTIIFGDGIAGNGNLAALPAAMRCVPSCPNDNAIPEGVVLTFRNSMTASPTRSNSPIMFDGRDKIASNRALAISKAGWSPDGPKTVLAGAVEVVDTSGYGKSFVAPVGQNTPNQGASGNLFFEMTHLFVQAGQNNTSVTIDVDGPGATAPVTVLLNQGQGYTAINVMQGATVNSSKPVQAHLITGDINAGYESRWFTLYPVDFADNVYYNPITSSSTDDPSAVFFFNPGTSSITITPVTSAGTQANITIPAYSSARYNMPLGSGARFSGTGNFIALGIVDSDSGTSSSNNQTHDWGMTLLPESYLSQIVVVGWGVGADDLDNNNVPDGNYSPVWVITAGPTTVYVDYDGDGIAPNTASNGQKYDAAIPVAAYQVLRLYDTKNNDRDQTGMRIFTSDGTKITAAWGQDPATAPAGTPALDLGTTIPPALLLEVFKDAELVDLNNNDLLDGGEELIYRIIIANRSVRDANQMIIRDMIPTHMSYVPGSSVRKSNVSAVNGIIPDDAAGTPFPLDGVNGYDLMNIIGGQIDTIEYRFLAGPTVIQVPEIINGATITVNADGRNYEVSNTFPVNQNFTPCTLTFGSSTYSANTSLAVNVVIPYITESTASVIILNQTNGDQETIVVTRTTGSNFTGTIQASTSAGAAAEDGTLLALIGHTISATYTNTLYSNTCTANTTIIPPVKTKQLYLSTDGTGTPDQDMDRVNPGASPADNTLATSELLTTVSSAISAGATSTHTFIGSASSGSAPTFVSSSKDAWRTSDGTTQSFSHSFNPSTANFLVVGIAHRNSDGTSAKDIVSVTWNGKALTQLASNIRASFKGYSEIWYLPATAGNYPGTSTTANVVITLPTGTTIEGCYAIAANFNGVDLTTPFGTPNSDGGDSGNATVTVAGVTSSQLVIDLAAVESNETIDPNSTGQVKIERGESENKVTGGMSYRPGSSGGTISWDDLGGKKWVTTAVALNVIGSSGTPYTFNHTTSAGSDKILIVGISIEQDGGDNATINGITYGSTTIQNLTELVAAPKNDEVEARIWYLVNPQEGTHPITISVTNLGSTDAVVAGATTFTGVNQTTPLGTPNTATDAGGNASITLSGVNPGELVYGILAKDEAAGVTTPTTGDQVELWDLAGGTGVTGAAATKPGPTTAGAVTINWTANSNSDGEGSSMAAVALKSSGVSAGVSTTTFTQLPSMCADFSLISGATLNAYLYVNVSTGTMTASPSITAAVKVGSTTIANLSGASYNSSTGLLTLSGAVVSAITVNAGQAITLDVTTAQTGVEFRIEYDESTKPSRIELPTTTVIAVDNIAVYDAAYPNGSVITSGTNAGQFYVRTVVSDPFGFYDITGLDIVITDPLNGTSSGIGVSVATSGCTRTYEYLWQSPTEPEGDYSIAVTAKEGSENTVTASGVTTFNLGKADLGTPCEIKVFSDNGYTTEATGFDTGTTLYFQVNDADEDENAATPNTIVLTVTTSNGDAETITLTETGNSTGVFRGSISNVFSAGSPVTEDNSLEVTEGALVNLSYLDDDQSLDACLSSVVINASAPTLTLSKTRISPAAPDNT